MKNSFLLIAASLAFSPQISWASYVDTGTKCEIGAGSEMELQDTEEQKFFLVKLKGKKLKFTPEAAKQSDEEGKGLHERLMKTIMQHEDKKSTSKPKLRPEGFGQPILLKSADRRFKASFTVIAGEQISFANDEVDTYSNCRGFTEDETNRYLYKVVIKDSKNKVILDKQVRIECNHSAYNPTAYGCSNDESDQPTAEEPSRNTPAPPPAPKLAPPPAPKNTVQ